MDKAYLIDMQNGKVVDVTDDCLKSSEFYWTEGSMSCDCNRAGKFGIKNHPCSDAEFKGERFRLVVNDKFPWKEHED